MQTQSSSPTILKAHISLNVTNLDRSVAFYEKMLGIRPVKIRPGYAKFDVQNPLLNLSLNASGQGRPLRGALSHLGLQVATTSDVLAIRTRWDVAGLQPRDEMQTTCCYAVQDKAWVTDPDGNEWEVFVVLADTDKQAGNSCCGQQGTLVGITQ